MHGFGFIDGGVYNAVPVVPDSDSTNPATTATVNVTNGNDAALTLTLGAFGAGTFHWNTASPMTIGPRATGSVEIHYTGPIGSNDSSTASVGWSVAGGASGSLTHTASHSGS